MHHAGAVETKPYLIPECMPLHADMGAILKAQYLDAEALKPAQLDPITPFPMNTLEHSSPIGLMIGSCRRPGRK